MPLTLAEICACGRSKAERARVCFTCLAAEPRVREAYIKRKSPGEAGKTYRAVTADGHIQTFATYAAAEAWLRRQAYATKGE